MQIFEFFIARWAIFVTRLNSGIFLCSYFYKHILNSYVLRIFCQTIGIWILHKVNFTLASSKYARIILRVVRVSSNMFLVHYVRRRIFSPKKCVRKLDILWNLTLILTGGKPRNFGKINIRQKRFLIFDETHITRIFYTRDFK